MSSVPPSLQREMATVLDTPVESRSLSPEDRARCARVARRLIEQEKARRYSLGQLYEQRDAEHERLQTALIAEIEACNRWISRFRSAVHRLEFVAETYELPPQRDRRAA
jgi:hypothetical protein